MSTTVLVDDLLNANTNIFCEKNLLQFATFNKNTNSFCFKLNQLQLQQNQEFLNMLLSRNSSVSSHDDAHLSGPEDLATDHEMSYSDNTSSIGGSGSGGGGVGQGDIGATVELCCNLCGNFYPINNEKKFSTEELINRENNFKCDKCSVSEHSVESEDEEIGIDDDSDDDMDENDEVDLENDSNLPDSTIRLPQVVDKDMITTSTTTLIKDNNSKPILKFSVSAILSDTREGVRVRNGKFE